MHPKKGLEALHPPIGNEKEESRSTSRLKAGSPLGSIIMDNPKDKIIGRFGARFRISLEKEGEGLKLSFSTCKDSDTRRLNDLYSGSERAFFCEMDRMMGKVLDYWMDYTRRPSWS